MTLWLVATLLAALAQTARFVLQKRLGQAGLSPTGATFARFLYAAPLALLAALATQAVLGAPWPGLTGPFWAFVAVGGVAQILATELTVRLFALRNFAVGVAFTKTEVVLVALFGAAVLGEVPTGAAMAAIGIGLAGVLAMARAPAGGLVFSGRAVAMGLAAGALFGVAATGYRGAALALEPAPFFLRATVALAAATALQTALMAAWLVRQSPGEVTRVLGGWRTTAPVGIMGMLGSLGWFTAFSLQAAAYVRAVGQVELLFTLAASVLVFGERPRPRELAGIVLVGLSVVILVSAV
jgi:drug/metabolite transporter (DMT)-like permease